MRPMVDLVDREASTKCSVSTPRRSESTRSRTPWQWTSHSAIICTRVFESAWDYFSTLHFHRQTCAGDYFLRATVSRTQVTCIAVMLSWLECTLHCLICAGTTSPHDRPKQCHRFVPKKNWESQKHATFSCSWMCSAASSSAANLSVVGEELPEFFLGIFPTRILLSRFSAVVDLLVQLYLLGYGLRQDCHHLIMTQVET